jgi:hypothetical protein
MVKTATNPAAEVAVAAAAARSAAERATQTNELCDIENAISEWEKILPTVTDSGSSEDQAVIFASYAGSMIQRWKLTHHLEDIRTIVSYLEKALDRVPHSSAETRYGLLTRLARVHESWYQNFNDNKDSLNSAIQCWEDAYGVSVILRQTKEAV